MPVDPLNLFTIPLTLALSALFAIAAFYDFTVFRRRRKTGNQAVYRCETCRNIYTSLLRTPLAPCSKCGRQNAPVRK